MQARDGKAEPYGSGMAAPSREITPASGRPLDAGIRESMEARFRHDFSRVRVHTDGHAARQAAALAADAYTVGEDIYFAVGRYRPDVSGRSLLAHELAHSIQQSAAAAGTRAPLGSALSDPAGEKAATEAAGRALRGHTVPALAPRPLGIARQGARKPAGSIGTLGFDSHWSYVVYDTEIRLRYYRDLTAEEAKGRAKKGLPGHVQVGTIPWVTQNPGNITQTPGAPPTKLTGYPATIGSIGIYGGRYAIFPSTSEGTSALGSYLRNRASFGKNPNLSLAQTIKGYKNEEPREKAAREAREKENAERQAKGQEPLPPLDVREKYLTDVKEALRRRLAPIMAAESGLSLDKMPPLQRRKFEREVSDYVDKIMAGNAATADVTELSYVADAIRDIEGRAAAPGVRFICKGFEDPTGTAAFDGEQKDLIAKLIGSTAAKAELKSLLGCLP
jgi:hypothetical protein